jgi:hypothetical protein
MPFTCLYCDCEHPDGDESDEHIIPEALFNRRYVLGPVCKKWNNFMSFSFEQDMLRSKMFRELRLVVDRPGGRKRVGEVTDVNGQQYERYFEYGREILKRKPVGQSANTIIVKARTEDGRVLDFELAVPFEVFRQIAGSTDMIKTEKITAKFDAELQRVLRYLTELADDPGSHPADLAQFLAGHDAKLLRPKGGKVEHEWTDTPAVLVDNLAPESFTVDHEHARKFFMKIAWTHACKQLGRHALNGPFARFMIEYVRSGWVVPAKAAFAPDLFDRRMIDGTDMFLWAHPPAMSETVCAALDEDAKRELWPLARERLAQFHTAGNLISFLPVVLNFDHRLDYPEVRLHDLELRSGSVRGVDGLSCRISLFGGTCVATVLLSTEVPSPLPPATRIDF